MMDKRRSRGVTVFGILAIVGGIIAFLINFVIKVRYSDIFHSGERSFVALMNFLFIFCNTENIFGIIYGVGILKLKEWARKMAIIVSIAVLIIYPLVTFIANISLTGRNIVSMVITLGFPLAIIYFFTRPKVKEQFR